MDNSKKDQVGALDEEELLKEKDSRTSIKGENREYSIALKSNINEERESLKEKKSDFNTNKEEGGGEKEIQKLGGENSKIHPVSGKVEIAQKGKSYYISSKIPKLNKKRK